MSSLLLLSMSSLLLQGEVDLAIHDLAIHMIKSLLFSHALAISSHHNIAFSLNLVFTYCLGWLHGYV